VGRVLVVSARSTVGSNDIHEEEDDNIFVCEDTYIFHEANETHSFQ
jgi:hypothetical protein